MWHRQQFVNTQGRPSTSINRPLSVCPSYLSVGISPSSACRTNRIAYADHAAELQKLTTWIGKVRW